MLGSQNTQKRVKNLFEKLTEEKTRAILEMPLIERKYNEDTEPCEVNMIYVSDLINNPSNNYSNQNNNTTFCILAFTRRFGCGGCKLQAEHLTQLRNLLLENRVLIIGVGNDFVGHYNFVKQGYFPGAVYLDPDGALFRLLEFGKLTWRNSLEVLGPKASEAAHSLLKSIRKNDSVEGDWYQIGGLLVIKDPSEMWVWRDRYVADFPDFKDILQVLQK